MQRSNRKDKIRESRVGGLVFDGGTLAIRYRNSVR